MAARLRAAVAASAGDGPAHCSRRHCKRRLTWSFGIYGLAVYFAELQRAHGWPASVIGTATTFSFLLGARLLPRVGAAIARYGARLAISIGIFLLGVSTIGLSQADHAWELFPCNLLMGLGWIAVSATAISITLAQSFQRQRGLALKLSLTGASIGDLRGRASIARVEPATRLWDRGVSSNWPEALLARSATSLA